MKRQHAQQGHVEAELFVRRQRQVTTALHGHLVVKLHVFRCHAACQRRQCLALRLVVGNGLRHGLHQGDLVEQLCQLFQCGIKADAAGGQLARLVQHGSTVTVGKGGQQGEEIAPVDGSEHGAHAIFAHRAFAVGDRLVEQRQRVTHRPGCRPCQQRQRRRFELDAFGRQHVGQMAGYLLRRHVAQGELQAAAQHGDRHFLRVGGGKDELDVRRRLFQRFQHGVEGRLRQHVHFVDDVDLVAAGRGRVLGVFDDFADVVDAGIGSSVDFQQVDKAPGVDLPAGGAFTTRLGTDAAFAVQAFGQNAGDGGLAHPAGTGQEIGMVQALAGKRIRQRTHDVLLADQVGKAARPPFAGKDLIAHRVRILTQAWRFGSRPTDGWCPPAST